MLPSISTAKGKQTTAAPVDLDAALVDDTSEAPTKPRLGGSKRRHTVAVTPRYAASILEERGVDSPVSPKHKGRAKEAAQLGAPREEKSDDNKPRFDALTLRQWFNVMDVQKTGHVAKNEWMKFLNAHENKQLKQIILDGTDVDISIEDDGSQRMKEALEMRRLLKIWRQLDINGNHTLEWEEFLSFFQRSKMLLEFKEGEHPRARLAQILGDIHHSESTVDTNTFEEFKNLAKVHTHGQRRQSLEVVALNVRSDSPTVADAKQALARRMSRRHSISFAGEAHVFSDVASPTSASSREQNIEVKAPTGKPDFARPIRGIAENVSKVAGA